MTLIEDVGINPQCSAEYEAEYAAICPRLRYGQRYPAARIFFDDQLGGGRFIDTNEWYAWLAKYDLRYFLAGFLYDHEYGRGVIALQRTKSEGHVERQEIELFSHLLPHLQRAAQISRRLEHQELWRYADGDALNHLAAAIILTDTVGRINFINNAAEAIVHRGDGLTIRKQRLAARTSKDNRQLDNIIGRASKTELVDGQSTTMRVIRSAGRSPYVVTVAPISQHVTAFPMPRPGAIVLISDPARVPIVDDRALRTIFELTAAEARLAIALASGQNIKDYAERSGIAIATARVHLRNAMNKSGVRRQADLIRLTLAVETGPVRNEL